MLFFKREYWIFSPKTQQQQQQKKNKKTLYFVCGCIESIDQFGKSFIFMILYFTIHKHAVFVYIIRSFKIFLNKVL